MGILDVLFNKEKRDLAFSKIEYEKCILHRRQLLKSFRTHAINELSLKYPDAHFLMNQLNPDFMVLRKNSGKVLHGEFADPLAPHLIFVSESDGTEEREFAIANYKGQIATLDGAVSEEKWEAISSERPDWKRAYSKKFNNKPDIPLLRNGFRVHSTTDLEFVFGGALFLNNKLIAKSSFWDQKPLGYFSERIYEYVISARSGTPNGISRLVLVMGDCSYNFGSTKYHYELLFDHLQNFANPKNQSEDKKSIIQIRDFLCAIEDVFVDPGEKEQTFFSLDEGIDMLNSPAKPDWYDFEGYQ